MSMVTPLTRITRPCASDVIAAAQMHQRDLAVGRTIRASVWKVCRSLAPLPMIASIRARSSGWMNGRMLSKVSANSPGSTPKIRYCPASHSHSPVTTSQSHEPIWPAASARLRRRSLSRSRAFDASSSAVRSATRRSSSRVELLELPRLAVQLGKHLDLGAQHLGNDRHRHIVHRAHLVAAQPVDVGQMDGGDEDDRGLLEPRMLADHGGQLEAVELRHADVDQHDGDVGLQQMLERLARRRRLDQVLAELAQDAS